MDGHYTADDGMSFATLMRESFVCYRPAAQSLQRSPGIAMSVKLTSATAQRIFDRVATGLNKQVSIVDGSGRVLASTDAALVGRHLRVAERAIALGEAVEIGEDRSAAIGLPLVYADAVVGAIVLDDVSQQGQEIGRVAKTLAELIIHQMTVIEQLPQQKWARDKFVHDLLHGRLDGPPEATLQEARIFGIDLELPRVVALVDFGELIRRSAGLADGNALPTIARTIRLEHIHRDLIQQARRALAARDRDVYSFVDDRSLAILAAVDGGTPADRRRELSVALQRFLDTYARANGGAPSAGIGQYYDGWPTFPRSFADARFARETGTRLGGAGRVFLSEDLGLASLVCNEDRALKADLAAHLLGPLDAEPDLLATLETFLFANMSPSQTAEALHIHRHTLAYRLDKIARLTGLDPRQFQAAAQLYGAMVLRKAGCPSG